KLDKVIRGERFEGKKAFLTQIEPFFNEFRGK
ncbi:sigma-70 family RNA polymerase sigma factor, partial [Streptococcus gallolyticus subsp. gallolyticus]|nr:sigma-70 family RNA polymerase sigma factor [Streptococcus gallolyticus subsp. gallolyticus]